MDELEKSAYRAAEQTFNLNSPKQLAEILFDKLGLPMIKKTPSGAPSTSEEVLEKLSLDYPLPKIILDYRGHVETEIDLYRQAAQNDQCRNRKSSYQLCAGSCRYRTSGIQRSQSPEHSGKNRRGKKNQGKAFFIAPAGSYIVSRLIIPRSN